MQAQHQLPNKPCSNPTNQDNKTNYFDYTLKIIIIGDSGVGKSSIMTRYHENKFFENHIPTVGVSYASRILIVEDMKIKLQIWDTAGQEKFRNITKNYYRNCNGAIVAFSINSLQSYYSVHSWVEQLDQTTKKNTPYILVGTKKDLQSERAISQEEAKEYAGKYGVQYLECSSRTGQGINEIFECIGMKMKKESIDKKIEEGEENNEQNKFKIWELKEDIHKKCCSN